MPPLEARLGISITLVVPLIVLSYLIKKSYLSVTTLSLGFLFIALFVFSLRNAFGLRVFPDGMRLGESVTLALEYKKHGELVFTSSSHSYFIQVPLLIYMIGAISGMPTEWGPLIIAVPALILLTLMGVLLFKLSKKMETNSEHAFLLPLFISSLVVSSVPISASHMVGSIYRELGYALFILLLCYLSLKSPHNRREISIALLLITGFTLGSPLANILAIIFFFFYAYFSKRYTSCICAILPLSYMIYSGFSYILSLSRYTKFVLAGFSDFLKKVISFEIPERISPTVRTQLRSSIDTYMLSVVYIMLLLLSSLTLFFLVLYLTRPKGKSTRTNEQSLTYASSGALLVSLILFTIAYVGGAVKLEVPYSDIRNICMYFVIAILPFILINKNIIAEVNSKKFFMGIFIMLLIISSYGRICEVYPKSVYDPLNVIEDTRINPLSTVYTGKFLITFCKGIIVIDYKTFAQNALLSSPTYNIFFLSNKTLCERFALPGSLLVFNTNGLKYPSIYTSEIDYSNAYKISLSKNILYNSGNIIIAHNPWKMIS